MLRSSATWLAQAIVATLAVLGVTLDTFPRWFVMVLVVLAIAGAVVNHWQAHKTVRTRLDNAAAVQIKTATVEAVRASRAPAPPGPGATGSGAMQAGAPPSSVRAAL